MLRHQGSRVGVVFKHPGELQMRPAKTEIHRGLARLPDKFRQVVARPQPGENTIALPAPRNDLFAGEIGGKMPLMLQRIFFNAAVQPVIIPAQGDQHAFLFPGHSVHKVVEQCTFFKFLRRVGGAAGA